MNWQPHDSSAGKTLSVVVVNTNHRELLERCLSALFNASLPQPSEIIVVDNASTDGSCQMVESLFPSVILVRRTVRNGPAANYNAGFAVAEGEFLLVLNEDAEVCPDTISILYEHMLAHPDVAVAGPRLTYPDGRPQTACNRFPFWSSVVKRLVLQKFIQTPWALGQYQEERSGLPFHPDWMMATCLMVRRAALPSYPPYDEQFEVYYEETDLQYRLHLAGWKMAWVPNAVVKHHHGVSNFRLNSSRDILFRMLLYQSRYRYFRKHFGRLYAASLRGAEGCLFCLFAIENVLLSAATRSHERRMKAQLYKRLARYALLGGQTYKVPPPS